MTNWITVPYEMTGVASLAAYEAHFAERPMKIDDDSEPIDRKKVGDYKMRALDAIKARTANMPKGDWNDSAGWTPMTAARDIKAEGVTRAQKEIIGFMCTAQGVRSVAAKIPDTTERYKFCVTLYLDVLDDLGLSNV